MASTAKGAASGAASLTPALEGFVEGVATAVGESVSAGLGATSTGAAVEASGPLSGVLAAWTALLTDEIEGKIVEEVSLGFEAGCRAYLGRIRDFRLLAPAHDSAIALDLSPSLCEPLSKLNAELNGLRASLPRASLRRVWPPIATAVDTFIYTQLVRRAAFSAGGVRQLLRDVGALAALFVPLGARPQTALRRVHESCQLVGLAPAARAALVDVLLSETPPQPHQHEHAMRLQLALEEVGVYRLTVGEAAEILASVHEDGFYG